MQKVLYTSNDYVTAAVSSVCMYVRVDTLERIRLQPAVYMPASLPPGACAMCPVLPRVVRSLLVRLPASQGPVRGRFCDKVGEIVYLVNVNLRG